ncbi:hypothetical protein [Bdellovibrio sp. HCB-162]|uniref:hypothetical protein n=1 Tax=Bdellovibrio sp. HCB-162 TaxID=3394234 RepID=UPI0039BC87F0
MKLLICLAIFFETTVVLATDLRATAPDICKVECECWGQFGGDYDQRPAFLIGDVESWGYCPVHISEESLFKFHIKKNKEKCNMLGESSASRHLRNCTKNF